MPPARPARGGASRGAGGRDARAGRRRRGSAGRRRRPRRSRARAPHGDLWDESSVGAVGPIGGVTPAADVRRAVSSHCREEPLVTTTTATAGAASAPQVASKGLRRGAIGLVGSIVLGVVQTAPAYSVAVTLAFLVGVVGVHSPALLLAGFVPILCMTLVEREFVSREPDCGTVFVWVGRSLGPRAGWICSWTLLAATFISLANLANIAGTYFFLLFDWNKAAGTEWATIAVGLAWLGIATWLGVRGIELSSRVQATLLSLGLIVFAVVALIKVAAGSAGDQSINPSFGWLNPFSVDS